ncbi:MAG: proline--tRNA ligase [Thermaerobacterales bacterium]
MNEQGESLQKSGGEDDFVQAIARQEDQYSQWYNDVVLKAQLADYSPVRGCMVIRPYGYALWESIQGELDRRFKATGVMNAYFPLFIPESLFQKEAEHVEGFAPEVPWVTHAGEEVLGERLAVRPTSEIIIGTMYARWVQSYRDLPLLINQWCNVVRWERRTTPFLRTTEFLWQEGHTAHRDEADARQRTLMMLEVYRSFLEEHLAIPVLAGRKSLLEKFAGAVDTYTVEALMGDGRALQAGTSHYLGDGFAKVLGIEYLDEDGKHKPVHQTSWGMSTRVIGGLIMVHGDTRGLVLPPRVAPYQAVIVPIAPARVREKVLAAAENVRERLAAAGVRVQLDDRAEHSPGWKFNEWELRGVPLRLELGPRDLDAGQLVMVRRDTGAKVSIPDSELETAVTNDLAVMQDEMLARARQTLADHTFPVTTMDELKSLAADRRGFAAAGWCGAAGCETAVKESTGATIRCIPINGEPAAGSTCIHCGEPALHQVYLARAY